MEISVKTESDYLIVSVSGRLDGSETMEFDKQSDNWIEIEKKVGLDLSNLEYISSAGLRSILTLAKKLKAKKGQLFLFNLGESVKQVFSMSGFDKLIPVYEDFNSFVGRH
jgi:anti-anti-sigma factor